MALDDALDDRQPEPGAGSDERLGVGRAEELGEELLLVVGGLTSLLSTAGPRVALLALAIVGLACVPTSLSLPEVSADPDEG